MHYLMMISENPRMIFQAEILVKSIKRFSGKKPCYFTLVVQGSDMGPIKIPLPMEKMDDFQSEYLKNNVEILYTPYHWELGSPCRWFCKPKSSMCIMIDVDVVACRDLSAMYDLDSDCIHGVMAFKRHLNDDEWLSLGMDEHDRNFYFNMGMLVVPSGFMEEIGFGLMEFYAKVQRLFPEHAYYSGQISLSVVTKRMGIKRNRLPQEYNWFDAIPYSEMKKTPLFLHYFYNKNGDPNSRAAFNIHSRGTGYKKLLERSTICFI